MINTETKETMVIEKHGVAAGSMHHRDNGIGAIEISYIHYDHTSELGHYITVWTETPDKKTDGWGDKIFEGSIQALIALIQKSKEADKGAERGTDGKADKP